MVKRKSKTKPVSNLVVVSDLHCGCSFGLCPPEGFTRDEGGIYMPSVIQQKTWSYWDEFWHGWVPEKTKGEPFAVCINGDAVDGVHHNSTTQITHNLTDQGKIAYAVLKPVVDSAAGYYHVRGTEAHVGQSGAEEEALARSLGAIPDAVGNCARYELWIMIGDALCHLMHHIGTTSSSAHEASAINAELTAEYVEAARWNQDAPQYVIRSHRHRSMVVDIDCAAGYAAGIVTPGWQAKTPFSYKIAGARLSPPQFGGYLIRQGDEEHYHVRKVWSIARPKEETCYASAA